MRNNRLAFCLLTAICTQVGCSQTGGVRPSAPSNMRTVASVGDRPLPSVSGEPGASLRADADDLELPPSSGSRISGRVYDERGKPVANAKVRLAVTSTPGGKAIYATTDRSGAFTLRGLRPGTSYAVIAEYQGDGGMMTGRTQAKAPQVDVRISLQPRGGDIGEGHASIQPARPRVEPISNIDSVEDEEADPGAPIAMSTPKTSHYRPTMRHRCHLAGTCASRERGTTVRPRRSAGAGARDRFPPSDPARARRVRRNPARRRPRPRLDRRVPEEPPATHLDDDGPNPLPPALDISQVSSTDSTDDQTERPVRVARAGTRSSASSGRRSTSRGRSGDDKAIGIMAGVGRARARVHARGRFAGSQGDHARFVGADRPGREVRRGRLRRRACAAVLGSQTRRAQPGQRGRPMRSIHPTRPIRRRPPSTAHRRRARGRPGATSREINRRCLSTNRFNGPGAIRRRLVISGVVTLTGKTPAAKPGLARLLGGSRPPADEAVKPALCRFDPSKRQLVDFQLPDIDGKTASLHDYRRRRDSSRLLGKLVRPLPDLDPSPHRASEITGRRASASDRYRLRERCHIPGTPGQRKQGDAGTRDQLSRAPLEQGRLVSAAASTSDPVLSDDDLARPQRQTAGARARGHRSHDEPDGSGDRNGAT